MKILKCVIAGLVVLLVVQSMALACPTCYYFENEPSYQSVGEMESSLLNTETSESDNFEDLNFDGFTDYDKHILEEMSDEEINF